MTKPDNRFALFTNGSRFALRAAESLIAGNCLPSLIALPEYAPASAERDPSFLVEDSTLEREITRLFPATTLVYAPASDPASAISSLRLHKIEIILVACWPYLIDKSVYDCARVAINLHPSLLPDYPGPDPVNQQIARRESRFGASLHLLTNEFDRGDILAQSGFDVAQSELELISLEQRCATLGVDLFINLLEEFSGQGFNGTG